jgi:hypothetical protein
MTPFHLTPSCWSEAVSSVPETPDFERLIALIILTGSASVVVSGFDQETAATIANRLVTWGIEDVHVEGSGLNWWPTPRSVCRDLMARLCRSEAV